MQMGLKFHIRAGLALAMGIGALCAAEPGKPVLGAPDYEIRLETLSTGFDKKTCWVHARAGALPGNPPKVVLTMQKLLLNSSDVFYELNDMRTDDLGATWSGPVSHPDTLGRRTEANGVEVVACDFWPAWHARSGTLLGIGHTARYKDNKVMHERLRETCYAVYDEATRQWTRWETMAMPDEPRFKSAGAGCVQRVDLPDGDILLPVYFKNPEAKQTSVTVVRCRFDDKRLTYVAHGTELTVPSDRGLGEPSLTQYKGRYYLTMRHDKAGYVSTSDDGLNFSPPKMWTWDDGTELGNYNTQQHWVTHDQGLFLVYTRKGADNDHVFRHRAPLFIGQVDPEKLCVIRSTERILVPNRGARLGNFGVTKVSDQETWVTVTEWMQTNPPKPYDYTIPMKYGSNNAVFASRIIWGSPAAK